MKMNKQMTAILVLAALLFLAVGYIGIGKYLQNKQQEQLATFQQGAQYGYTQAVTQLVQQAVTCQQVPISFQNQTINMIAVECLQQNMQQR